MAKKYTPEEIRQLTHGIPHTRYPWALERFYLRQLRTLISNWNAIATDHVKRMVNPQVYGGSNVLKLDDDSDDLQSALTIMLMSLQGSESDADIQIIVQSFVSAVNTFSHKNVQSQALVVGRKAIQTDTATRDYLAMKVKENVALIKSIKSQYMEGLEKVIYHAVTAGGGVKEIAKALTATRNSTNNRAALIATDQTGSIAGQLNAYRQRKAGATSYIWRSVEDSRVRSAHAALDGTIQPYDGGGDNGMLPGEPIRCRCFAEPIFDL